MKGTLISSVVVVAIIVASSVMVISMITPLMDEGKAYQDMNKAKETMSVLDSVIKELSQESVGATRTIDVASDFGTFHVAGREDKLEFRLESLKLLEPGITREGNLLISSGPMMKAYEQDIDNDNTTDLVLENGVVLFAVKKLGNSGNWMSMNMTDIITRVNNKQANINISKPKAWIFVDETDVSAGNGYSELTKLGSFLTSSGIKLYINTTTARYEALFTLGAGNDFLEMEVKQID
ncbi:MAG: hypothetical protein V1900_03225 [Candidatus Aenigmatarchaeota archaeon]